MNSIKLSPVFLSLLLLLAHFYRNGYALFFMPLTAISLLLLIFLVLTVAALALLVLVHKPWVVRMAQSVLVLGGIEWARTLFILAKMRLETGAPWIRLSVILGVVAVFTCCSALVFRFKSLRERYNLM